MEAREASKCQMSSSVMVSVGMAYDSEKTFHIFIPVDIRVNQNMCLVIMKHEVVPWVNKNIKDGEVTIYQDSLVQNMTNVHLGWYISRFMNIWEMKVWS